MRKKLFTFLCLLMILTVVGCSSSSTSTENSKTDKYFKVIGIYYNENNVLKSPDDGVSRNWINVVYEINNTSNKNWNDDFFFGDGVNVLTVGSNEYEYNYDNTSYYAKEYGFKTPDDDREIWAGAKMRYFVNFVVNQKDIKKGMEGKFYIKYNDMEYTYNYTYGDLKKYTSEDMSKLGNQ